MATIEDVARLAGVSRMTVSRAMNKSGYISEKSAKKIEAAIEELNYRPNMIAKMLVTRRSNTIAYVMLNISDPFHNMVNRGLESAAYHKQYTTIVCDAHSPNREQDYLNMFVDNRMGGVIIHHLAITEEQVKWLADNGVKCVLMDNEEDIPGVSHVNSDNYAGGKMAGEYLVSKGHRRIGCVHAPLFPIADTNVPYENTFQFKIWRQRLQGFQDALREADLIPAGLFPTKVRFDYAKSTMPEIVDHLLSMENRPTALNCEDDIMAFGLMDELWSRGLKAPDDFAIVGHDGLEMCRMVHPYLTTISQPRYEMGRCACELLIKHIEGQTEPEMITLKPALMVGETA